MEAFSEVNKGTLWYSEDKKSPAAPDFKGSVKLDKHYLLKLIDESTSGLVEVKLDGWRKKVVTKFGEKFVISVQLNTWKPEETVKVRGENDDDIPF
jgi:hypothetical protein